MLARLASAALRGLDAESVDVEIHLSRGLPCWSMVGLPDAAVRESRDRVRSALINSHFEFPLRHITVNLSPADRRKDGPYFDLPVAIGLLLASGQIQCEGELPFMAGELALDGRLNPIRGVLPLAIFAAENGYSQIILPAGSAAEAQAVEGIEVLSAPNLLSVAQHLSGRNPLLPLSIDEAENHLKESLPDMADIRGQYQARRALEIAAAGGHHLLMSGPPGVGKSMLAARLPGILPQLTQGQRLEVARIYSICGDVEREPLAAHPPFRSPHHTSSDVAMIGGGCEFWNKLRLNRNRCDFWKANCFYNSLSHEIEKSPDILPDMLTL